MKRAGVGPSLIPAGFQPALLDVPALSGRAPQEPISIESPSESVASTSVASSAREFSTFTRLQARKEPRLLWILIMAAIPAAFLSAAIIFAIGFATEAAARNITRVAEGRESVAPVDNAHAGQEEDCAGPRVGTGNCLGFLALWLLLTTLILTSLGRVLAYWCEKSALKSLRAKCPLPSNLDDLASVFEESWSPADATVRGLFISMTGRFNALNLERRIDLDRADEMRRRAVDNWSAQRPLRKLLLKSIAIAAAITGLSVTLIDACDVIFGTKGLDDKSGGAIARGLADALSFGILGLGIALAALVIYKSLAEQNQRLASEVDAVSFDLMMAAKHRLTRARRPPELFLELRRARPGSSPISRSTIYGSP